MKKVGILIGLLLCSSVLAQQSPSFRLTEHVINAGGNPQDGVVLASASFRITLDALGDAAGGAMLTGSSFRIRGGFVGPYLPPLEALDLRFTTQQNVTWAPESSVGHYNLYMWSPQIGGPGTCVEDRIPTPGTVIPDTPPFGYVYHYLVAAANPLWEEGPWGHGRTPSVSCH